MMTAMQLQWDMGWSTVATSFCVIDDMWLEIIEISLIVGMTCQDSWQHDHANMAEIVWI